MIGVNRLTRMAVLGSQLADCQGLK